MLNVEVFFCDFPHVKHYIKREQSRAHTHSIHIFFSRRRRWTLCYRGCCASFIICRVCFLPQLLLLLLLLLMMLLFVLHACVSLCLYIILYTEKGCERAEINTILAHLLCVIVHRKSIYPEKAGHAQKVWCMGETSLDGVCYLGVFRHQITRHQIMNFVKNLKKILPLNSRGNSCIWRKIVKRKFCLHGCLK